MPRLPQPAHAVAASAPAPRGARHAALLLHAMAPQDRAWMLEALPAQERAGLVPLLAELEALGIERNPALIADATAGALPGAMPGAMSQQDAAAIDVPQPALSDEAMLHALDAAGVRELAACLRTEPAGLVAELLRLAAWPWREDLLAALELGQRRRIEVSLSTTVPGFQAPSALRAALIAAVAARLRERPAGPAAASAAAPWQRLKRSLHQVFHRGASLRRGWNR